jgi:hypothetical protein
MQSTFELLVGAEDGEWWIQSYVATHVRDDTAVSDALI